MIPAEPETETGTGTEAGTETETETGADTGTIKIAFIFRAIPKNSLNLMLGTKFAFLFVSLVFA